MTSTCKLWPERVLDVQWMPETSTEGVLIQGMVCLQSFLYLRSSSVFEKYILFPSTSQKTQRSTCPFAGKCESGTVCVTVQCLSTSRGCLFDGMVMHNSPRFFSILLL